MNNSNFIGRICKDPELTTTPSGVNVCKFTLAVNRKFDKETSDFFNIVAWRGLADNIHKYCKKGSKVFIAGELQNRSYDAKDGTKRYVTEIIASECEFLDTKKSDEQSTPTSNEARLEPISDDGLPF